MLTRHPAPAPEWYFDRARCRPTAGFRVRDIERATERVEAPDQRLNATDVRGSGG